MKLRMRRQRSKKRGKENIKLPPASALWRARINTGAFAITMVVLSGQEFSGSWARANTRFDFIPVSRELQIELATITAATFTLPSVPAPPSPNYQPGEFATANTVAKTVAVKSMPTIANQPAPTKTKLPSKPNTANIRRTIFGAIEFRTRPNQIGQAWNRALARMDNELPLYAFCEQGALQCPENFLNWRKLISNSRHLKGPQLMQALNSGINALVDHREDTAIFGSVDHWASPLEFLDAGGDCEDYTILKYASLIELGMDERDLRIVVVKDTRRNRGHAVLSVQTPKGEMILDNLTDEVRRDTTISHYKPVYSLNRNHHYLHIAARLSRKN